MNNALRIGNFTSSEIVALMSNDRSGKAPGAPFHTYINECNMERRLGRPVDKDETTSKEMSWGQLVERRAMALLGDEYQACSQITIVHPQIDCWAGSPDTRIPSLKLIGEIKCPFTLKSFCTLVDAFEKGGIDEVRERHKQGDKYYYQIVSNACLTGSTVGELIVYVPYLEELQIIREMAMSYDGGDQHRYKWIAFALDEELPHLIKGGYYKNLYKFRFDIPFIDKQALHARVELASKYLVAYNLSPVHENAF